MGLPAVAAAVDFPLSGTISVGGQSGALPNGGAFTGSGYDQASGVIAPGTFTFPQSSTTYTSPLGPVVVAYQLSQTGQSSGQVAADGVAALTAATLRLQVISASSPLGPINVGTCVLEPIIVALAGTGSSSGLQLSDPGFTIPPVGATDCGGFGSQINQAIAGDDNSIDLLMAGDFAPPSDQDTIFVDGFEVP
ncbi:hypothetical protein [Dokdonella sp.]|uniref:hypothetical protein n=1 Tax=Dokdonella sp. TaxID=2291710 RepID=UPI001B147023|nr:hypothetical protein [Dokdonella sp.]MBO9663744.1 hypothetical protein [Dokdonella sp.]